MIDDLAVLGVDVCRATSGRARLRADQAGDGSPGTMFGHFSTFGDWYKIDSWFEGHFVERLAPGAFERTIRDRDGATPVRVLLDHGFDPQLGDKPLGVPSVLEERDQGPYAEVPLFDGVPQLVVSGLRGGAYGQSFRFRVLVDEWVESDADEHEPTGVDAWDGLPQRTIREVALIEFGPTPFPANPNADAGLRSGLMRSTTDAWHARRDAAVRP